MATTSKHGSAPIVLRSDGFPEWSHEYAAAWIGLLVTPVSSRAGSRLPHPTTDATTSAPKPKDRFIKTSEAPGKPEPAWGPGRPSFLSC